MSASTEPAFASRFRLVERSGRALLLDLETGQFYQLNRSALTICTALRDGQSPEGAAAALAGRFGIPLDRASSDVRTMVEQLRSVGTRPSRNAVQFHASGTDLVMHMSDAPVLTIVAETLDVRLLANTSSAADAVLLWAVPHLLALMNQPVIHASAVNFRGRTIAFSGASGAGKTTLARTFVAHGAIPESEDLVVVSPWNGTIGIHGGAEAAIRDWVRDRAAALAGGRVVDGRELRAVVQRPTHVFDELLFVDAARRDGSAIALESLSGIEAIAALLENSFAEIGTPQVFDHVLESSVAIANSVGIARCTVPRTLEGLGEAIARYSRNTAS